MASTRESIRGTYQFLSANHAPTFIFVEGPPYRSKEFKALRAANGLKHSRNQTYRPRTNGTAERFIQAALRECAFGHTWQNLDERN
ncbi:MAG: DDE-type integrase/transposase/recombinase [Holophagaceae bacterium]|uniref:DDE-type integrase/transposase/recombinase n=1 Tax=Candidatus Geothrix skivensis TaxID=2954439 RepID=A0A9D7SGC5_9BACT|nr:DDE-type integrase/transposase/recombinase [Candidatus Geothrix skivensis]